MVGSRLKLCQPENRLAEMYPAQDGMIIATGWIVIFAVRIDFLTISNQPPSGFATADGVAAIFIRCDNPDGG